MSRVLIFGGHGKIALRLAPLLVERGDVVTGVIRNPDHADDVAATGAIPLIADVEHLDAAALGDVVQGQDAVVWSAGAGGGSPERTYAVDRDAAIRSMEAAKAEGVSRYVMVSYLGARPDHGVSEGSSFFAYAEAKAAADKHLRTSELDYTILQPGPLTLDEPTGLIEVADPGDGRVARADVAGVIAAVLADGGTVGRTIAFGNGGTPIAEAVAARP
ncbi:putative NAD(P)-binding protein [Promicromonospora sp. AC04]|uniref:SDR family oxidoreductase n=1 Tax=Promicromonospora sp. AC04 TaxID=2135723 RepID=UPI000D386DAD|nr:SDR family oxidoreductase [Promicromonospora sp. AC04]PUB22299.1 putative NAD(P)-binding protein [Promicromonospora sp. AC04]